MVEEQREVKAKLEGEVPSTVLIGTFLLHTSTLKAQLLDVTAWLVINSMKTERLQFDQLSNQNLANIWRANAFERFLQSELANACETSGRSTASVLDASSMPNLASGFTSTFTVS